MVYKLHPGDIIGAWLRWQGAVITAANEFIAFFFSFAMHISHTVLLYRYMCRMTHNAYSLSLSRLQTLYFHM